MTRLLHVISSPRGAQSESNRIAAVFLEAYLPGSPDVEVDTLDLWDGSLPGYYGRGVEAKMNALAGKDRSAPPPRRGPTSSASLPAWRPPTSICSPCRCGTTAFPGSSSTSSTP
jgi:Flavodoxin-like fold